MIPIRTQFRRDAVARIISSGAPAAIGLSRLSACQSLPRGLAESPDDSLSHQTNPPGPHAGRGQEGAKNVQTSGERSISFGWFGGPILIPDWVNGSPLPTEGLRRSQSDGTEAGAGNSSVEPGGVVGTGRDFGGQHGVTGKPTRGDGVNAHETIAHIEAKRCACRLATIWPAVGLNPIAGLLDGGETGYRMAVPARTGLTVNRQSEEAPLSAMPVGVGQLSEL
jgi:hypothetical protein